MCHACMCVYVVCETMQVSPIGGGGPPQLTRYVRQPDGSMLLWVGKRSLTKSTWPGKLDHLVAGGQVRLGMLNSKGAPTVPVCSLST